MKGAFSNSLGAADRKRHVWLTELARLVELSDFACIDPLAVEVPQMAHLRHGAQSPALLESPCRGVNFLAQLLGP